MLPKPKFQLDDRVQVIDTDDLDAVDYIWVVTGRKFLKDVQAYDYFLEREDNRNHWILCGAGKLKLIESETTNDQR